MHECARHLCSAGGTESRNSFLNVTSHEHPLEKIEHTGAVLRASACSIREHAFPVVPAEVAGSLELGMVAEASRLLCRQYFEGVF